VNSIEPESLKEYVGNGYEILDVRRSTEAETEHVSGAINISLIDLENRLAELDKERKYLVHCAGGYRSMIASSILVNNGFRNIVNIHGGFGKIKKVGNVTLIAGKCPTTLRKEKLEALNL
jgi:rhodanese-related sulfurtransferase